MPCDVSNYLCTPHVNHSGNVTTILLAILELRKNARRVILFDPSEACASKGSVLLRVTPEAYPLVAGPS